jgi:hypothetical protein
MRTHSNSAVIDVGMWPIGTRRGQEASFAEPGQRGVAGRLGCLGVADAGGGLPRRVRDEPVRGAGECRAGEGGRARTSLRASR